MHIILNRYSPRIVRLSHLFDRNVLVLVPKKIKEKYDLVMSQGEKLPSIIFIEDYTLPNLVKEIRKISQQYKIDSVTTLIEEDIEIAGLLHDHFVNKNTTAVSNTLFKDKYYMRSFLYDIIEQPIFRLIESKEDLDVFWRKCSTDCAVIKPRNGLACKGIKKIIRGTEIDIKYLDGNFMIEEFVNLDGMITCDGYSVGNVVKRFYVHENMELLLDSLEKKSYYLLRTTPIYHSNYELIIKALNDCKKVLNTFSVDGEATPFHFEWFYDINNNNLLLCEVGKRFGGGYIPKLIKDVYNIDVIKEYWDFVTNTNVNELPKDLGQKIPIPQKISATFAAYKNSGIVDYIPDKKILSWAEKVFINLSVGEYVHNAENIIENSMLVQFVSNDEKNFYEKLDIINSFSQKIVYRKIENECSDVTKNNSHTREKC